MTTEYLGTADGSSPRGRGKPDRSVSESSAGGLIPAWAGKTANPETPCGGFEAHPRVGGENHAPQAVTAVVPGSSPRGRGKRDLS